MLIDVVQKNRSYRTFYQDDVITRDTLKGLVRLANLCPSASNLQPLKYILICDPVKNNLVFPHLGWAGYLKDWDGPRQDERPTAYIIILGDKTISQSFDMDCGIAAQTMLLGAVEMGFGGCMIASIGRKKLRKLLKIKDHFKILLVIALGKPKETVIIERIENTDNIKYWRDNRHVHHVPKRLLEDIIIELEF